MDRRAVVLGLVAWFAAVGCGDEGAGAGSADARGGAGGAPDGSAGDAQGGRSGGEDAGPPEGYVRIEPGEFWMGSPPDELGRWIDETRHRVRIARPFLLKATEVTKGEWRAVMGNNPLEVGDCGDDCPVERVTWLDSVAYVNTLSRGEGRPECYDAQHVFAGLDCRGYRLPTEAEWEYAARAGTETAFHSGPITTKMCNPLDPNLDRVGWYCGNAGNRPHPVALKAPNAWGLYDMHGNVAEWAHDAYADNYGDFGEPAVAVVDPVGPAAADLRTFRGGGWSSSPHHARAAYRTGSPPANHYRAVGLRPARTLP